MGEEEGGFEVRLYGVYVYGVFESHGTVDYMVHFGLEKEPTYWGQGFVGVVIGCRRIHEREMKQPPCSCGVVGI